MALENESNRQPLDIVIYGFLTGIGLALGAGIVALIFRLFGVRWTTA